MDRRCAIGVVLLTIWSQGLSGGPRLFFLAPPRAVPTVTSTLTSTRVISEVWLSSCLTYATTLPNCPREARADGPPMDPRDGDRMELSPSKVQPILSTEAPQLVNDDLEENERTFSKPFWEDLMGLAFPLRSEGQTPPLPSTNHREKNTVTRTVTVTATKRVKGPKTVVSFSITGCLPSKLPFDLERCEEKVASLRIPADIPTEEQPSEVEAVASDPAEEGKEDTPAESEQMIPNESETLPGTPEEHEELGSGFAI